MNRKSEVFMIIFILLVVTFALIIALNLDYFDSLIKRNIETYGYPAIWVFAFLCDLLEQPISSEVPAIFGYLLGMNVVYLFVIASLGSSIASLMNFYFGKRVLSSKILRHCETKKYANYCKFFYKHGNLSLALAALTPIPYVTFCWLSGAFNMSLKNFFIYGLLTKAARIGFALWIVWLVV
ncbi:VTT domain-containing protein [Candidatus Pacearchaeota archaeon]|nr:VTT domain-containing protein [Candidatus Pacearchaeota archaeon]